MSIPSWKSVHQFWFGLSAAEKADLKSRFKLWFHKSGETDSLIHQHFGTLPDQALAGELTSWKESPEGNISLIVVLDQFPRNIFRNNARAFFYDNLALSLAIAGIKQGIDQKLTLLERIFFYLPFEHSENLLHQEESLKLYLDILEDAPPELFSMAESTYKYAQQHHRIIAKFGRFPHRNLALERTSTPEEIEFLKTPGSSF